MRVLVAGATGAIGRPLIHGLKQQVHSVFCLVRSAESARTVTEMGAEAVIGDALDAVSVRAAIASVRPDSVINELTSLPRHYTPAEMKAAAERDSRIRREGNINLLAGMRESGVRRYVLQSSGFWYAPGPGLADESSPLAADASPGVAAGVRTYVELESTAFRASGIDSVAMRYGFFYGPGTWYTKADDTGEQVRRQQVPIIGAGQGVWSFVHIEDAASATVAALECAPGAYNIVDDNPSQQRVWLPAFASYCGAPEPLQIAEQEALATSGADSAITRRAYAGLPTRRPDTNSISARARSNGSEHERSQRNIGEASTDAESSMSKNTTQTILINRSPGDRHVVPARYGAGRTIWA